MNIKLEIKNIENLVLAFDKAPKKVKSNLKLAINKSLRNIQEEARRKHKFISRSGNLERSIAKQTLSDFRGTVFLNEALTKTDKGSYGVFLHNGVNHSWTIEHKNKSVLRWASPTGFIFAKHVEHKPIKANPFLYEAGKNERDNINDIFNRHVLKSIKEAGILI